MRILVADDDPILRRLLESMLEKWGYESVVVDSGYRVLQTFATKNPPVIAILDVKMPGLDGVETCRRLRDDFPGDPYIILLTANNRKEDVVRGLEAGANDYISKPFDTDELHARLEAGVRVVASQTNLSHRDKILERIQAELRSLSLTDELTGILNRRGFMLHANQYLRMSTRNRSTALLFYADMDGLKAINDTFGHEEGSVAIIHIARILKETFRDSDIIARLGGDEFAVLATGAQSSEMSTLIDCLGAKLDEYNLHFGLKYKLDLSIGTVLVGAGAMERLEELVARADCLMYQQKRAKKERVGDRFESGTDYTPVKHESSESTRAPVIL